MPKRNARPRAVGDGDVDISNRIRAYRMERNMSQEELGDKLGISFQQIQKYEKGVNRLSVGRMVEICKVLQMTPHELIGWEKSTQKIGGLIDPETFKLSKVFMSMPDHLKPAFRTLMTSIMVGAK